MKAKRTTTIAHKDQVRRTSNGYSVPQWADTITIKNIDTDDVAKLREILEPYGFLFLGESMS